MDLSVLGTVKKIVFTMSSSDNSTWGMNTPAYFAFDNFGASRIQLADKTEYTATEDTDYDLLTYTRTFGTTNWQPLYVPFVSSREAWGKNVDIAEMTSNGNESITVTLLAEDATVDAHTPYFIRAKQPGSIEVNVANATLKAVPVSSETTIEGITFTGVYSATSIPSGNNVLHKGEIMTNNNAYNLEPMRWYISNAPAGAKMQIFVEGDANAIHNANASASQHDIYNVKGVKQSALQRGVNIIRKADGTIVKILK